MDSGIPGKSWCAPIRSFGSAHEERERGKGDEKEGGRDENGEGEVERRSAVETRGLRAWCGSKRMRRRGDCGESKEHRRIARVLIPHVQLVFRALTCERPVRARLLCWATPELCVRVRPWTRPFGGDPAPDRNCARPLRRVLGRVVARARRVDVVVADPAVHR